MFDLIVGTSGGGLIALALGKGLSAAEAELLFNNKSCKRIFGTSTVKQFSNGITRGYRYSATQLEALMKEVYGETTCMSDLNSGAKICITSSDMATNHNQPFLFRSYELPQGSYYTGTSKARVWHAGRGTSSAFSYFPYVAFTNQSGFEKSLGDGGQGFNNPANIALRECVSLWPQRPIACVVSIGTGLDDSKRDDSTPPFWRRPFIFSQHSANLMKRNADTEIVHGEMELHAENSGYEYHRLNVPGIGALPLDETDSDRLNAMQRKIEAYYDLPATKVALSDIVQAAEPKPVRRQHADSKVDGTSTSTHTTDQNIQSNGGTHVSSPAKPALLENQAVQYAIAAIVVLIVARLLGFGNASSV
jgi:Patatin-like phospholipase